MTCGTWHVVGARWELGRGRPMSKAALLTTALHCLWARHWARHCCASLGSAWPRAYHFLSPDHSFAIISK